METGGTMTLMHRAGDEGTFNLAAMRDYLPSYGSLEDYMASVRGNPIREAVHMAAMASHQHIEAFIPPRMAFVGRRSRFYPFKESFPYMQPQVFRTRFGKPLQEARAHVIRMNAILEKLLRGFSDPSIDWEYEYARESSKRWRAWYDLTKGRLLALSVRCLEYNAACVLLPNALLPTTNNVRLTSWNGQLRVPDSLARAREAERLLTRCVETNPGTPWASLARWELDSPLGIQVRQISIPPPPPPPPKPIVPAVRVPARMPTGVAPTPTFTFPNL
ncbi:hypothetical protein RSSM_01518 [Rhodopirellula sallentina SM41]|uniref:Uncharacterized protein n=1 Tax=Rhodopirellula sallentina SM41 TaxID=1263870 RepID=M5U6Y5_9BACT|nr:hypothetical protein RSSM_01518 [Rhodopirellula sallentina SM41]